MRHKGFFRHYPSRISKEKDVELTTSFPVIDILSGEPIPGRLPVRQAGGLAFRFNNVKIKAASYIYNLSNFPVSFKIFF